MDDALRRLLEDLAENNERREELLIERDALIVRAWGAGVPVTRIAEAVGLDRTQVHRIVKNPWIVVRNSDLLIMSVWRTEQEALAELELLEPGAFYHRQVGTDGKGNMTPFPE